MIQIKHYFSLVKFSHTIFAMPFALTGFFLAMVHDNYGDNLSWKLLILVILCMILARNTAMGFNRYIDANIDRNNARTASREIPSGIVSSRAALVFVIANSLLFIFVTFFINRLVFFLSPIALAVVIGYSFTKRFTALCHFILGLGLALAPIGAYLAVSGEFALAPILLSFAVLFWVSGFDIIYALQDEQFDKSQGLKSVPVWLGRSNAMILSSALHIFTAILLIIFGLKTNLGFTFWIGLGVFSLMLAYQHLIIRPSDLSRVNQAFFTTNGIASIAFAVFTIAAMFI